MNKYYTPSDSINKMVRKEANKFFPMDENRMNKTRQCSDLFKWLPGFDMNKSDMMCT